MKTLPKIKKIIIDEKSFGASLKSHVTLKACGIKQR